MAFLSITTGDKAATWISAIQPSMLLVTTDVAIVDEELIKWIKRNSEIVQEQRKNGGLDWQLKGTNTRIKPANDETVDEKTRQDVALRHESVAAMRDATKCAGWGRHMHGRKLSMKCSARHCFAAAKLLISAYWFYPAAHASFLMASILNISVFLCVDLL